MASLQRFTLAILSCLCLFFVAQTRVIGQTLQAAVAVDVSGLPVWNYTITNLEPLDSGNWLDGFFLPIAAPITNVVSPNGWTVDTDFTTFVLWQNAESFPYPNDIPPSGKVSGFQFQSSASSSQLVGFEVDSWDHVNDQPGTIVTGQVLAPGNPAISIAAPEPGSLNFIGMFALVAGMFPARRFAFRAFR